jgi:hypothetical protein
MTELISRAEARKRACLGRDNFNRLVRAGEFEVYKPVVGRAKIIAASVDDFIRRNTRSAKRQFFKHANGAHQ